eukprot:XP_001703732.1 predicted protein [Chlamydomonas reinhardtii]
MAHPTPYLPEGVLEKLGEITIAGKTLVTKDATLTPLGVGAYWALAGFLLFTLAYKLSKYYTPLYFKMGGSAMVLHHIGSLTCVAGLKSHPIYVVNGLLIVASWTVARMATFLPFFKTAWDVRAQVPLMNPLSQVLLLVFPATLAVLNTWWYYKIVKGALKVLGPKKKPVGKTQ